MPITVVSAPLSCRGADQVPPAPAVRREKKTGVPVCQTA